MKTILALVLVALFPAICWAQALDQGEQAKLDADQDLQQAKTTATAFVEKMNAKNYTGAVSMMNPKPPFLKKGGDMELKNHRIDAMKNLTQRRQPYGSPTDRKVVSEKRTSMAERPPDEEFFEFSFRYTYPDGRTSFDGVTIVKKGGQFLVERFQQ